MKCKARDTSVEELLQKLGKSLEKQGGSIIMVQYIIKNIQTWRNDQPQIHISPCITNHEKALNQAIEDQNILGWHLFLRELHSVKWNICYESWHEEKKGKEIAHTWDHYAIKLVMNFSIAIWVERCTFSKNKFKDSEHDLVLFNCQNLLEDITQNPLSIMKSDWKSLIIRKVLAGTE